MEPGESWAYRARATESLIEVLVLKVGTNRPPRVLVRFVADVFEGREEWVPPARLKVLWRDAEDFIAREKRWDAITTAYEMDETAEDWAARVVFDELLDVSLVDGAGPGVARVHDVDRLARVLDLEPSLLRAHPFSFVEDDGLIVPWPITEQIVRRAAELNADQILRYVDQEEDKQRRRMIHGEWHPPRGKQPGRHTRAEFFAELDNEPYQRPCRDVLRRWCGADAVDRHDELRELRLEVHRLGMLVHEAVQVLRQAGRGREASRIEHELGVPVEELRSR